MGVRRGYAISFFKKRKLLEANHGGIIADIIRRRGEEGAKAVVSSN